MNFDFYSKVFFPVSVQNMNVDVQLSKPVGSTTALAPSTSGTSKSVEFGGDVKKNEGPNKDPIRVLDGRSATANVRERNLWLMFV